MKKPEWWPTNPYPESVFPMPEERYPEIVPDPVLRTALSGMLGRLFWDIAADAIWAAMYEEDRIAKQDDHQVLDPRLAGLTTEGG